MTVRGRGLVGRAVVAVFLAAACARDATRPAEPPPPSRLRIAAAVGGTAVTSVSVTVDAPDLRVPLVFNLALTAGVAAGTIEVSAGSGRVVTVRGFDARGVETHRGAATVTVREGVNPTIALVLEPLTGEQALTASLGSFVVAVTPAEVAGRVGDTVRMRAVVSGADGPIETPVRWASSTPSVVRVDETGLATLLAPGAARVGATARGAGGEARVRAYGDVVRLRLAERAVTLARGETRALGAVASDASGQSVPATVTFATSDPRVATVGERGLMTAVGGGYATVVAASGAAADTLSLTVPGEWAAVAAGFGPHTCGLLVTAAAYCWGSNSLGQLGLGTTDAAPHPTPNRVAAAMFELRRLYSGNNHTCGIDAAGAVLCWGDNRGRFGNGDTTVASTGTVHSVPTPGAVRDGVRWKSLALGWFISCGVSTTDDGYCWGPGQFRNNTPLGDVGDSRGAAFPSPLAGELKWRDLGVGQLLACGLSTAGAAYCWGHAFYAGAVTRSTARTTPQPVVGGHADYAELAVTAAGACGRTTEGRLRCWGFWPATGQVDSTPRLIDDGRRYTRVVAGNLHYCALDADGRAYCSGGSGLPLGNGSTAGSLGFNPVASSRRFVQLSAGASHSCGITNDRVLFCWGLNSNGMLGDSTTTSRLTPVPVLNP